MALCLFEAAGNVATLKPASGLHVFTLKEQRRERVRSMRLMVFMAKVLLMYPLQGKDQNPSQGGAARPCALLSIPCGEKTKALSTTIAELVLTLLFTAFPLTAAHAGAMLLHIGSTTPRVAQRGTTVDVTIQGMCLKEAREIVFFRPGIRAVSIEPLPKLTHPIGLAHGGRIEEQILCKFEIAPNCVLGEHPFRVRTATELTSLGTFHVSPFQVVDENERGENSNDTRQTALPVTANVTVRGRMGPSAQGDVDLYRVPVVAGQRLSVEVDSVRIADVHYGGSEYDLAVRILDDAGRELAANDDNPLHLQDPLAAVKVPRDGFAFVEVRRSLFVPSDKAYCVHIGTNRRPLVAFPPGGPAGTSLSFELLGDPLGPFTESIEIPSEIGMFEYFGDAPSSLLLRSSPYPNVLEDATAATTRVERLPAALNGRIDQRGDVDAFQITVKKGDRLRVRVFAASLGSPIDPKLRIRGVDSAGTVGPIEVEMDDSQVSERDIFGTGFRSGGGLKDILDPSVIWEPKADGDYLIELEDTSGSGGPTAVYRIEVEPAGNSVHTLMASTAFDWEESVRTTGLVVPQGNRWTVNVNLPQGQGSAFRGELELSAHGLPEGVRMIAGKVPAGRSLWPVQFVAEASSKPCNALITLEARPVDPAQKLESKSYQAIPFINQSGGSAWRTVRLDRYVLAVTEAPPFTIEITQPPAALVRGGELAIPVRIVRRKDFNEPVEFQCDWVPPGVSVQPATIIPAGESEAVLRITGESNAPLGKCPLVISASTTREDLDAYLGTGRIRVSSEIVDLIIAEPFVELASQPAAVRRGERKKYVWTVQHKSPFEGTAAVKLLGLPKGVSVIEPLPTLTRETKEIAFEIKATSEALLGSVRGVSCEITVQTAGQEIRQRTGNGTLRIDPLIEDK